MTVDEFRKTMTETEYIPAGSALHQAFHAFSQEALKITTELNGAYHTPDEVRALMLQLTASEIDKSFGLFPPFHTDCGKNTKIGKRVFINTGCQFQDQGGITIGDDVLVGPQTIIGDKVWLGARVTACPDVTIGKGAIVGAGAVVMKDVPPRTIVAGVPKNC